MGDSNKNTNNDGGGEFQLEGAEDGGVMDGSDNATPPTLEESAKIKREKMIQEEMENIFEDAQGYILGQMIGEVDMGDDAKDALMAAAMKLAYTKKYYDVMEDNVVYFPTCKKLIVKNSRLLKEAEKIYRNGEDEFPPEYTEALLKTVVTDVDRRKVKEKSNRKLMKDSPDTDDDDDDEADVDDNNGQGDDDDDDSVVGRDTSKLGSDLMEKLAMSWREAIDESLEYRKGLC